MVALVSVRPRPDVLGVAVARPKKTAGTVPRLPQGTRISCGEVGRGGLTLLPDDRCATKATPTKAT